MNNSNRKKNMLQPLLSGVLIGVVLSAAVVVLAPIMSKWEATTVLAAVTVIATFCNAIIPAVVTFYLHKKDNHPFLCMRADITADVMENGNVKLSSWVENIGNAPFETYITNIYIDKGKGRPLDGKITFYDFPELLNHKEKGKSHDCILALKCKDDNIHYPRKEEICQEYDYQYEDFRYNRVLMHLSNESVQFIQPGERFYEDIVVQLHQEGVYRVTLVVTTKTEGCECTCSTKQFYVPGKIAN